MADENKPAFYPRVGNIKAKNFKPAKPMPFIDDPRAMELPQYGDVDLSQPTKANLELGRRMTQRDADLKRQQSADTSPLEKAAGALQTVRLMGSALTQAINSLPTRMVHGDAAAEKFIEDRMYKPEQPLAYEYAGDVGEFLDRLETQYKLPPILPEAVALQYLSGPATSQAMKTAGRGAEQAGRAIERRMEPVVKGALERGGLPREMVMAMGANTQSNVIKPKGGNWFDDNLNRSVQDLKKSDRGVPFSNEDVAYLEGEIERLRSGNLQNEMVQDNIRRLQGDLALNKQESALNNWLENTYKNYVKNEMATPEDRVRKMFDRRTEDVEKLEAKYEKDITKLETKLANAKAQPQSRERDQAIAYLERDIQDKIEDLNFDVGNAEKTIGHIRYLENEARHPAHGVISVREDRGFPTEGMATSTIGKGWENLTDSLLGMKKAGRIGRLPETVERYPWLEKVDPEAMVYKTMSDLNKDTGIDHVLDVLRQDVRSGAITPEQLSKITMDQAIERAANFDREAGVKMRQTAIKNTEGFPTYKEYPAGYKWIELTTPKDLPSGYKVVQDEARQTYQVVDPNGESLSRMDFDTPDEAISFFNKNHDKRLEKALRYEGDTMGHCVGGYCPDVVAGRSRIFSLRDRRGEPHVTVEVKPQQHLDYNTWFNKQPEEVQNRIAQRRIQDKNHDIYEGPEYLAAREALPPAIYQVKGKQNARPIEKYDPYTQDFVRSGNWDILGDFVNTGLYKADPNELGMYLPMAEDLKDLPVKRSDLLTRAQQAGLFPEGQKYLNRSEWEDILRKQYQAENPPKPDVPPDLGGMKRGGVVISNNPDTMMLELGNKRMKEGGSEDDTKPYFGGAGTKKYAAAKKRAEQGNVNTLRDPKTYAVMAGLMGERPDEMGFSVLHPDYQAIKDVAEPAFGLGIAAQAYPLIGPLTKGLPVGASVKNVTPMKASEALGKIEGRPLKITQSDRTKVGEGYLGGPGFSGLQLTDPRYREAEAAWGVQNAGTAKTILGGGKKGDNAVYAAMIGTPTQHQSNQMVFDKLYGDFKKAAKRGELTPELRDLINMRLASAVDKKGNPVFPADVDIMDKKFRDIADTFSRRSIAGHLMGGVQVGGKKGQIIDYDKIIRSTTDPALIDQPTGALGNRLFTLSGGIIDRPDLHPAFPAILQGEDLGLTFTPVERNLVMKDFVDKTMREKKRMPGYMDYARGNPPTQLITEDILTELQKLGLKEGGAVHKAEGGEVSGDDLILEERPL